MILKGTRRPCRRESFERPRHSPTLGGRELLEPDRMTRRDVGNWVDRGQAPEPELTRVLAIYFDTDPDREGVALRPHVVAIRDMVEAGTSAGDVAGYLKHVERERGVGPVDGRVRALASVALWHVAQVARVRASAT
jgi:hypothetical protein